VINNARCALQLLTEYGSLAEFFWQFEPRQEDLPPPQSVSVSDDSKRLSATLKKKGWKFVGPTTTYAFMQAMGLINDHQPGCVIRQQVDAARAKFDRPG